MKKMKSVVAVLVALLVMLTVAGPVFAAELPDVKADLSGQVVILHTNDSHGHVDDNMGFAAVMALKKDFEAAGAEVLMLDAGDTFHGMPYATLERGAQIPPLLNDIGYAATTAGNHDFNYGVERLEELVGMLDFPMLAANVADKATGKLLFDENMIIETETGPTFGLFGLATPDTATSANPELVGGLDFLDPVQTATEQVAALREEGVDYIIALTHLGVDQVSDYTSDGLAAEVPGIDLIIDGHSHTEMAGGVPLDESIELVEHGDTVIASTGCFLENVGVVLLGEDGFDAQLATPDDYTRRDAAITAAIDAVKAEQEAILSEVVGETPYLLEGEREQVRTRETNLGNFTADALIWATGADVAMMNGGTIRASIEAGDITLNDLITVFPFGNYIMVKEIDGASLKEALEHGVSAYPEVAPFFPHVGGMTFTLNAAAEPGQRVEDLEIAGEPMDPDKTYLLAVDDFLGAGGDDYDMIGAAPEVAQYGALEDAIKNYLATGPEFNEEAEGRITVLEGEAAGASEDDSDVVEEDASAESASASEEDTSAAAESASAEAESASMPEEDASAAESASSVDEDASVSEEGSAASESASVSGSDSAVSTSNGAQDDDSVSVSTSEDASGSTADIIISGVDTDIVAIATAAVEQLLEQLLEAQAASNAASDASGSSDASVSEDSGVSVSVSVSQSDDEDSSAADSSASASSSEAGDSRSQSASAASASDSDEEEDSSSAQPVAASSSSSAARDDSTSQSASASASASASEERDDSTSAPVPGQEDAAEEEEQADPDEEQAEEADAPDAEDGEDEEAEQDEPTEYTVQKGDSLWKIAKAALGNGDLWVQILELNSGQISDPNVIYPGQVLLLPAA